MFPHKQRLQRDAFSAVREQGQVFRGRHMTLRLKENKGPSRFSIVVSRKVAQSAVQRHKIRRRIYAILKDIDPALKSTYDVVVFAGTQVVALPYTALGHEVHSLFQQAGALKPDTS